LIVAMVMYSLDAVGPRLIGIPAALWIAGIGGMAQGAKITTQP